MWLIYSDSGDGLYPIRHHLKDFPKLPGRGPSSTRTPNQRLASRDIFESATAIFGCKTSHLSKLLVSQFCIRRITSFMEFQSNLRTSFIRFSGRFGSYSKTWFPREFCHLSIWEIHLGQVPGTGNIKFRCTTNVKTLMIIVITSNIDSVYIE